MLPGHPEQAYDRAAAGGERVAYEIGVHLAGQAEPAARRDHRLGGRIVRPAVR